MYAGLGEEGVGGEEKEEEIRMKESRYYGSEAKHLMKEIAKLFKC